MDIKYVKSDVTLSIKQISIRTCLGLYIEIMYFIHNYSSRGCKTYIFKVREEKHGQGHY